MRRYFVIIPVVAALSTWVVWEHHKSAFYTKALPDKIKTYRVNTQGSDAVVLLRKACGGVIFDLTDETLSAIGQQGLSFFQNARQGRGYPATDRNAYYYSYAEWQDTPVPQGWVGPEGFFSLSLQCMNNPRETDKAISEALKLPGSYFTTKRSGELVVIPSLKMAILAYYN